MSALYYPTYHETDETTVEWHDWLVQVEAGETEPSELETIADVCATARCTAVLRDAAGWERGRVDRNGDWRLS